MSDGGGEGGGEGGGDDERRTDDDGCKMVKRGGSKIFFHSWTHLRLGRLGGALHSILLLWIEPALLHGSSNAPNVLLHILAIKLSRLRIGRAIRVRIMKEGLDGSEDGSDVVSGRPAILENVEAELAVGVDVGVEHSREELDGWGFVGVGFVEGEEELEGAVFEGRFGCEWARTDGRKLAM